MNLDKNVNTTLPSLANKSESGSISECTAHSNNILTKLKTFYELKILFDIVLVADIDKTEVSAHRIVLSASSDYFLGMFQSNLKEAKSSKVTIKDIDGLTLRSLLNFMYTGSIELHCETIEDISKAADFFQIETLVRICCEFMQKQLNASNCLGIASFADMHNYCELNKNATLFALRNFEKVSTTHEFFQINEDQMCQLISSDDLYVKSEETVLQSIVAWVEYDKENREKSVLKMLSLVRFTSLEPKFIEHILKDRPLVLETVECSELMSSWLEWHSSKEQLQLNTFQNTRPRKNTNKKLAFISGERSNDLTLQVLDPESNTWSYKKIPQMLVSKENYRITFINQKLIITGGDIDSEDTNSVECFNLLTNEWTNLSPMGSARSDHEATVIDGYLYVVGGSGCSYDDRNYVEKYDLSTNRWEYLESLQFEFAGVYAKLLPGHLYPFQLNTNDFMYYNSVTNEWIEKNEKMERIAGFGCAEVGGKLYIVGGCGYKDAELGSDTCTVKYYNIENDDWETKKSLNSKRSFAYCTALNDRLIVAGGHDSPEGFIDLVEEYDPEKNEWTQLTSLLPHGSTYNSDLLFTM